MSKPKVLAWCDFIAPTGFGNVAKNLLDEMHNYFELSIVGINYYGNTRYNTDKYFVYPVTKDDMLGFNRLKEVAAKEQPDILFLFQDIFHISELIQDLKTITPNSKIVTYFPIDGAPYSIAWRNVLDLADVNITYSDWAIQTIKNRFPDFNKPILKLYHGVDLNTFYTLPTSEIDEFRKTAGWTNKFVVVNVNRFQPRKAIPLSLRAVSMFIKGYKVCKCGNHFPLFNNACDLNMCPVEDVIEVYDIPKEDVMFYMHMLPQEFSMGPGRTNLLQHFAVNCGFTDGDYNKVLAINGRDIYRGGVPESELNKIYNGANVNISSSLGEGCGLSLLEAAACGTSSIAPRNSAIPEQLRDTGILVKNNSVYMHPMDNAHVRPNVDPWELKLALDIKYEEWKKAKKEKVVDKACVNNIKTNFLWNDKREMLTNVFHSLLNINNIVTLQ